MLIGSGFSLYKHYCGGDLKKVTVNHTSPTCHDQVEEAPSCHAVSATPHCHQPNIPVDDCCDDQVTWERTDQYVFSASAVVEVEWEVKVFLLPIIHAWVSQHEVAPVAYLHYHPPLLASNFDQPATLQVFRL